MVNPKSRWKMSVEVSPEYCGHKNPYKLALRNLLGTENLYQQIKHRLLRI